jgi:hypothetical protein
VQYALVAFLQAVLVVGVVAGVRAVGHVDATAPPAADHVASAPPPAPAGDGSVSDHLGVLAKALTDALH